MTPLRQRMLEDMSIRNLVENTQQSYLQQISSYAKHFHRSPEVLGPEDVRTYQVYMAAERNLSATSVGIATTALRFLYKITLKQNCAPDEIPMPKRPFKLPVCRRLRASRLLRRCCPGIRAYQIYWINQRLEHLRFVERLRFILQNSSCAPHTPWPSESHFSP